QAGHQDALAPRPRGLGKDGAPAIVSIIADLTPINRDEDDRLASPEQHQAVGEERGLDLPRRGDATAHERMAQRRRHLGGERRQAELWFFTNGTLPIQLEDAKQQKQAQEGSVHGSLGSEPERQRGFKRPSLALGL